VAWNGASGREQAVHHSRRGCWWHHSLCKDTSAHIIAQDLVLALLQVGSNQHARLCVRVGGGCRLGNTCEVALACGVGQVGCDLMGDGQHLMRNGQVGTALDTHTMSHWTAADAGVLPATC
jgi:hypothetical protein